MNCSKCGAIVNEGESSCAACGTNAVSAGEGGAQPQQPGARGPGKSRNPLLIPLVAVSALLLVSVSFYLGGMFSGQLFGTAVLPTPEATLSAAVTPTLQPSPTPIEATATPEVTLEPTPTVTPEPVPTPSPTVDPADLEVVKFADKQVEAWIRLKYIEKDGPITVADMKDITVFQYDTVNDKQAVKPIKSLDDLRHCTNLEVIRISNQPISSIAGLKGLDKLTNVVLFSCNVSDLSPLAGKESLREVWISGNPVKNAGVVLSLPNLMQFNAMWGTNITDISPLAKTNNLMAFHCENKLKDYSPLLQHTNLKSLTLSNITNADFVAMMDAMKGLTAFRIQNSKIERNSLRLLKGRNFYGLSLNHCGLSDIAPLAQMAGVNDLRLTDNSISDLTPLAGLTMIDYCLDLRNNKIRDYSPLKGMTNLQSLYVMGNPVTNDKTLKELEKNGCKVYR